VYFRWYAIDERRDDYPLVRMRHDIAACHVNILQRPILSVDPENKFQTANLAFRLAKIVGKQSFQTGRKRG
jgi:hypothetical protein